MMDMHTDEEVERCYEEFYEDVHTEFLKFGEMVNFKVCRNGSFHLRGNVYVNYKSLESAVLAYQSLNGRYFAGKQITCEFVGVTRWKVAICGEYMKSRLKTCSRGTACNFIHCFRNPGGDYEWADWDNPPPRYWMEKMVSLFGPPGVSEHDKHTETQNRRKLKNNREITTKFSRYSSRRSRSSVVDSLTSSSGGDHSDEDRNSRQSSSSRHKCSSTSSRKRRSFPEKQQRYEKNSNSEDDRYKEKDIALHSLGDRDRKNSSRATSSHWRKGADYLDGHENLKEQYSSSKAGWKGHDSSRKYPRRRKQSSGQGESTQANYEHMKPDENYLAECHGRYDPNSGHNSDLEQSDASETNSCFIGHERYGSSILADHKTNDGILKSREEISDVNNSKDRSRHRKRSHRKHSDSREQKDQGCQEKHQSSSHDQSMERKNMLNKERSFSKTTRGRLNLEKTDKHTRSMVESPEDIHGSRRHDRSSRRKKPHREKAIDRDDKTNTSGVDDLEQKDSRKRSRSRSPSQSSSISKREINHGSLES